MMSRGNAVILSSKQTLTQNNDHSVTGNTYENISDKLTSQVEVISSSDAAALIRLFKIIWRR